MPSFFPRGVLDEILNLIESVSEGFPSYSYVAPLVHAYNATRHDSTGFSPYFLMFGRHSRLAVDAYLGLNSPHDPSDPSRQHYASKLQKRLNFAYQVASSEAQKSAGCPKLIYDSKVRESTVDIGTGSLLEMLA